MLLYFFALLYTEQSRRRSTILPREVLSQSCGISCRSSHPATMKPSSSAATQPLHRAWNGGFRAVSSDH